MGCEAHPYNIITNNKLMQITIDLFMLIAPLILSYLLYKPDKIKKHYSIFIKILRRRTLIIPRLLSIIIVIESR